ncbi:hypothetical protein K1719_003368 [Acacia pycnantha]|nr:hypothetical protein K1719_003368 [Acacia pycnantha]
MHLQITSTGGCTWSLTVTYASPSRASRKALWDKLYLLAPTIQGAWLLGGDLNGTLLHGERWSLARSRCSYDRDLLQWVDMHDMRDVGFVGPEYTWKRDFDEFVKQAWHQGTSWLSNISHFTQEYSKGIQRKRKKQLLHRLDGINRCVARYGMQPKYENLQLAIWKDLEDVLLQDSLIWPQKARAEWSVYGDRNTKYFHAHENRRRKAKKLEAIKADDGSWIFDTGQIKDIVASVKTVGSLEEYHRDNETNNKLRMLLTDIE